MQEKSINYRAFKVHGTSIDGKSTVEFSSRFDWEDVELDVKRAFEEKGCEAVVIYEAKEIRINL